MRGNERGVKGREEIKNEEEKEYDGENGILREGKRLVMCGVKREWERA